MRTGPAGLEILGGRMSQENVEIVRRIYSEWERGNLEGGVELFDPEIVFVSVMPDAERIVSNGPEEVGAFMREFLAQWRDYRLFGDEFREVGTDNVFVVGRHAGTGRQSGVAVEDTLFSVWTFRGGKVVRLLFERDRAKALEAAGLRE
jgi:ketosteroid isomerase-like protein